MLNRKLLLSLTALGLTLVTAHRAGAQEDVVLGKNRTEWLKMLQEHKEAKFRRGAVIALTVIGPKAQGVVSGLIQALESDENAEVRQEIANVLGQFGADGKGGVDALAARLQADKDAKVRETAARSLGKLAEFASIHVMGLGRALKDMNADVRSAAAEALTQFGDKAKLVVPQLTEAAQDAKMDVFTRLYAVQILGKQAGDDSKAVLVITAILGDEQTPLNLRQAVPQALGNMGPAAAGAAPVLAKIIADAKQDKELRRNCAVALGKIGPDAASIWPAVQTLLHDPDAGLRYQAIRLTGIVGKGNAEATKELMHILDKENNVEVLLAAIQETAVLGINEAVPRLEDLARTDLRLSIREAATAALKKIKG